MTTQFNYTESASSIIGKSVRQVGGEQILKVVGLDTKMGDLSGNKVPYLVLSDEGVTVVTIHPRDAKKLMVNGNTDKWEIFEEEQTPEQLIAEMQADIEKAKEEVKQNKAPSKKQLAVDLYTEIVRSGKSRKDFVERAIKELSLTDQGAKTYWSNFHRTSHPWHIRVEPIVNA